MQVTLVAKKGSGRLAKRLPEQLEVKEDETTGDISSFISKKTGTSVHRIRLSVKPEKPTKGEKDRVLSSSDKLLPLAVDGKLKLFYRDLGPQIAWRTVFLAEYLGPLLIHPLFYHLRTTIYGKAGAEPPTRIQQVVYVCILLHFLKREFETAFVHKFSLATMPLFNLFKNCAHYWLLSGVLVAYFGYAPESWWTSGNPVRRFLFYFGGFINDSETPLLFWVLPLTWLVAEVSNLLVHLNLASLRPAGSTERRIPFGYGFHRVSCPNYYFESLGWLSLTLMSGNWALALFAFVGTVQMYFWALKKHRRYLAEFPDYPKNRRAMFPYLLK